MSFVPQVAVGDLEAQELPGYHRNIDMDKVTLSHADENPLRRRPGSLRHTPQGVLHGAPEEYRAELQRKRQPGQARTRTMVDIDPYCPLIPSPEFV